MSIETLSRRSFLGLEGQHVFITGAAGAIGGEAVREFLGRSMICSSLCFLLLVTEKDGCKHACIVPESEPCLNLAIENSEFKGGSIYTLSLCWVHWSY